MCEIVKGVCMCVTYYIMHHYLLVISSNMFLLPIAAFFIQSFVGKTARLLQKMIVALLLINYIVSVWFWYDGRQNTIIHTIDAFFARLSSVFVSSYILILHDLELLWKHLFLHVLYQALRMFYFSNRVSKREWCSDEHVWSHFLFHLLVGIGATFAFI